MTDMPLDAYWERLGLSHAPTLSANGLVEITQAQTRRMVFENLDPYLSRPVLLDAESLTQKLIYRGRGGYCFELNGLIRLILTQLGYQVRPHMARVADVDGVPGRRSHLLLEVTIEGRSWLVDCGFGRGGPLHALPLEAGRLEIQSGDAYRMRRHEDYGWVLERRQDGWQPLYAFHQGDFRDIDIEMANFYTNMWPTQRFRTELVAARPTERGRISLLNTRMRERHGTAMDDVELTSIVELERALVHSFGLPESEFDLANVARRLGLDH